MEVRKQDGYLDGNIVYSPKCKLAPALSAHFPAPTLVKYLVINNSNCLVHSSSSHLTPCLQEVSDLGHGYKVSHMWLPRGGCAPVNFKFPLLQDLLQLLFPQNLLLWKQKSWFNADSPPCSSFTLQTKQCVTRSSSSEPVGKMSLASKRVLSAEPT